jgi:hypothetical protein
MAELTADGWLTRLVPGSDFLNLARRALRHRHKTGAPVATWQRPAWPSPSVGDVQDEG